MNKPLNKYIDHTLLKAEATPMDIERICKEALEYDFYAVCVNSYFVPQAKEILKGSDINIASVIGFPLGAMSTESKVMETEDACKNGASEIDMVINIGLLKARDMEAFTDDIRKVVDVAAKYGAIVKVIIETCLLTEEEKVLACQALSQAGAAFAKTSTGFSTGGATPEDVKLMRETCPESVMIKASGGIRDLDTAMEMIEMGADRLGVSAGIQIMEEYNKRTV